MNNVPQDKSPNIDPSNGGTVSLPASWITAINALIAAGSGLSGLTTTGILYATSATGATSTNNAILDASGNASFNGYINIATGQVYKIGTTIVLTASGNPNNSCYVGFVGNLTMTGVQNTLVGFGCGGSLTTGYNNTFIGSLTGIYATTALWCTGIGVRAFRDLTTGAYNTALGVEASYHLTIGSYNVAVGTGALSTNTTGDENVGIGAEALFNLDAGFYNSALGRRAGFSSTTGSFNTFNGMQSGYSNTTGQQSVYLGAYAGRENAAGSGNVIAGYKAGYGVAGNNFSNQVIIGFQAGQLITTSSNSILIGYKAGDNITTALNNIIIGYDIDAPSVSASYQISIANLIFGVSDGATGTTISLGRVGIGISSPAATAILDLTSTLLGFLPPRMTTTERNAISTPAEGLVVYDLTLHNLYVYNGTIWVAAT